MSSLKRKKLYDMLEQEFPYDLGGFDQFTQRITNPQSAEKMRLAINNETPYDMGDSTTFYNSLNSDLIQANNATNQQNLVHQQVTARNEQQREVNINNQVQQDADTEFNTIKQQPNDSLYTESPDALLQSEISKISSGQDEIDKQIDMAPPTNIVDSGELKTGVKDFVGSYLNQQDMIAGSMESKLANQRQINPEGNYTNQPVVPELPPAAPEVSENPWIAKYLQGLPLSDVQEAEISGKVGGPLSYGYEDKPEFDRMAALRESLEETGEKHREFGRNLGGIFGELDEIDPENKTLTGGLRSVVGGATALPSGLSGMAAHLFDEPPNFAYEFAKFVPQELLVNVPIAVGGLLRKGTGTWDSLDDKSKELFQEKIDAIYTHPDGPIFALHMGMKIGPKKLSLEPKLKKLYDEGIKNPEVVAKFEKQTGEQLKLDLKEPEVIPPPPGESQLSLIEDAPIVPKVEPPVVETPTTPVVKPPTVKPIGEMTLLEKKQELMTLLEKKQELLKSRVEPKSVDPIAAAKFEAEQMLIEQSKPPEAKVTPKTKKELAAEYEAEQMLIEQSKPPEAVVETPIVKPIVEPVITTGSLVDRINNAKGDVELSEIVKSKDVKRSDLADIVKERDIRNANGKPVNVDSKGISKGQLALIIKRNLAGDKNVNVNVVKKIDKANQPVKAKTVDDIIKDKEAKVERVRKDPKASGDEVIAALNEKAEINKLKRERRDSQETVDVGATKGKAQRDYSTKVVIEKTVENYRHFARIEEVYKKIEELGEKSESIIKEDAFNPEQMARDFEAGKEVSMDTAFDSAQNRGGTRYHELLEDLKAEMGLESIPDRAQVKRAMAGAKDIIKKQGEIKRLKELGYDEVGMDIIPGGRAMVNWLKNRGRKNKKGEPDLPALMTALNIKEMETNLPKYAQEALDFVKDIDVKPGEARTNILRANRKSQAEIQGASMFADNLNKKFSEEFLEDATFIIEKTKNPITGESLAEITKKAESTKGGMEAIEHIKQRYESTRVAINEFLSELKDPQFISHIEDYVSHIYEGDIQAFVKKWKETSNNAKKRKYPTYEEAIEAGLKPKTLNAAETYRIYANTNWRIASNRSIAQTLRSMFNEDGNRMVLTQKEFLDLSENARKSYKELNDTYFLQNTFKKEGIDYNNVNYVHKEVLNPLRHMFKKNHTYLDSKVLNEIGTVQAVAKFSELAWSLFHHWNLTESSIYINGEAYNPIRGLMNVGEYDVTLGRRNVGPAYRQGKRLLKIEEFAKDAVGHGLKLGAHSDIMKSRVDTALEAWGTKILDSGGKHVPGLETFGKGLFKGKKWWDTQLWENYHNPLKAMTYNRLVEKMLKRNPELNPKQVKETVASHINDAFGGLEWESINIDPRALAVGQQIMLAVDYSLANLRVKGRTGMGTEMIGGTTKANPTQIALHRKYLAQSYITRFALSTVFSKAIYNAFGDPEKGDKEYPWEYETGEGMMKGSVDLTPLYRQVEKSLGIELLDPENPEQRIFTHFDKQGTEVERLATLQLKEYASRKAGPFIQEAAKQWSEESLGSDFPADFKKIEGSREPIREVISRGASIASKFVPFSFSNNQFLFALPKSKGMTAYEGKEYFEAGLKTYSNPTWLEELKKEVSLEKDYPDVEYKSELIKMFPEIVQALKDNGHNPEIAFNSAKQSVISNEYKGMWKMLRENRNEDKSAVNEDTDEIMRAIIRLGGTESGLMSSYRGRIEKNPVLAERLDWETISSKFRELRRQTRVNKGK